MINFFFRDKKNILLPWIGKEPIYSYIKNHLDASGCLPTDFEKLPDDEEFYENKPFRWIPGAMDGVFTHHISTKDEIQKKINNLIKLIRQQIKKPDIFSRRAEYLELMDSDLLDFIDSFLDSIRKQSDINLNNLYNEALWLATNGVHRNVVKTGIALLGTLTRSDNNEQVEVILTLGKHEEFTLYSVVAIQNCTEAPNSKLFELAKCVDGWGKIHVVERLSPENDEIKDWFLKYGCQNRVMNEYLAYTCAVKGDLKDSIHSDKISPELYKGAGTIITALINGGPAEEMDDYEHSVLVIPDYIRHSKYQAEDLEDFLTISRIKDYLEEEAEKWEQRYKTGWNIQTREDCSAECSRIIINEKWKQLIWRDIDSGDSYTHYNAVQTARLLNIDIWPKLFEQLNNDSTNSSLYYDLMRTEDINRIKSVIEFAESSLPLEHMIGEPADELGLGKEFNLYQCLDFILQDLSKFEGIGQKLILAGLRSPVTRNRNMALRVLRSWQSKYWPEQTIAVLSHLADIEPNKDTKNTVLELLQLNKH